MMALVPLVATRRATAALTNSWPRLALSITWRSCSSRNCEPSVGQDVADELHGQARRVLDAERGGEEAAERRDGDEERKERNEEAEGQLRRQTEDVVAHSLTRNLARNSRRVERFGALRRWIPTSPCPRSHQSMGQHGRSEPRETVTRYAVATVALGIRERSLVSPAIHEKTRSTLASSPA